MKEAWAIKPEPIKPDQVKDVYESDAVFCISI